MAEYINPDYVPEPEKMNVKKGLEGVVMDTSSVSKSESAHELFDLSWVPCSRLG